MNGLNALEDSAAVSGEREVPRRLVGSVGTQPGPLLICIAGLHGNEPAGLIAVRRVLARLAERPAVLRGRLVVLAGNLAALRAGTRFIDRDLNRAWTAERVAWLRRTGATAGDGRGSGDDERSGDTHPDRKLSAEDREQRKLLVALDDLLNSCDAPVHVVDLHTTSAKSPPFLTVGDTLRNRSFAERIPLPMVLGIEEQIDGSLSEYLNERGCITIGVEAGHHDLASSVERHEQALWMALIAAGNLSPADVPEASEMREQLAAAATPLPSVFEVRHRHPVAEGDGFRMRPGMHNFQRVRVGELLARDRRAEIRAPESGRLFLPLYQPLGDDGFFIVRRVRPVWLRISAIARRLRLDALAHWLPGVERHPECPEVLLADPRIARWRVPELFHLLGFRKERRFGDRLAFIRRAHDHAPPMR